MFKRRSGSNKTKAIRKRDDSHDGEEEHREETETAKRIDQVRKKRKLLAVVQNKRGVDSVELSHTVRGHVPKDNDVDNAPIDASTEGILDQKHRKAMEEYINDRIALVQPSNNPTSSSSSKHESKGTSKSLTHDALFSEIAASSVQLSGRKSTKGESAERDDSMSGGAVLVAGTGIAEVILPDKERLKVEEETEKAKSARASSRKMKKLDPAPSLPQAIPNRFSVTSRVRQTEISTLDETHQTMNNSATEDETKRRLDADSTRMGFEALKNRHHGRTEKKPRHVSNDQKVFKNFVTRQRELKK